MPRLVFNRRLPFDGNGVERIVKVCNDRGYDISRADAQAAWEEYSDSMCASWLGLPEDDEDLFRDILVYCSIDD